MTPTVFRESGFRFLFFSREEPRMHIHAICPDGEAKFWLKPEVELAKNHRLSRAQLKEIERIIQEHYDEIASAWNTHFSA